MAGGTCQGETDCARGVLSRHSASFLCAKRSLGTGGRNGRFVSPPRHKLLKISQLCFSSSEFATKTATKPTMVHPTTCSVLSCTQRPVSSFQSTAPPLVHFLNGVHLVGLKKGHSVKHHTCLASHRVGFAYKSRIGPTGRERE